MSKNIDPNQVYLEERTLDFIEKYQELKEQARFGSNEELATILGYKRPSSITEILGRRQNIPPDKYQAFIEHFYTENSVSRETFTEKRRRQKTEPGNPFLVPLIPVKAQAGYVRAIDQATFIDTLEQYALPPGVNPHGAIWRYWEVEGDSMEPAFHGGDIILTSQVHQMDWENLRNFYLYVIVTPDRVLFKRIYCKNQLEWVLISENEDQYPQQLLPVEYIKEVWVFRRSIISKAPPTKEFKINI